MPVAPSPIISHNLPRWLFNREGFSIVADTLDASGGQLKPPQPQKPALPVAGFWARGLAFVADAMLLGALFYVLIFAAKEALFALGRWNMPLSALLIVAYFVIGDGPIGKGRTVGKFLSGVRIADYAGQPLQWGPAILRVLLKTQIVLLQIPVILTMESLEQSIHVEYWKIIVVLVIYSATLLATLFFAIHMGLSPLKQAPYDVMARSLVFKMGETATREAIIEMYDSPPLYNKLRRAAIAWSSIISLGFFFILCWPLVRDSQRNSEYFQKERAPVLEQFEVAGLGLPQWPLLSPNPVEFVILDAEPAEGDPAQDAAANNAATSPGVTAEGRKPRDIKVRLNYVYHGGAEVPAGMRAELEAKLPALREWFYPWFYKNFGTNTSQANVLGFQVAVVRVIPIIVRPHREDILVLELSSDPAMQAAAAEAYHASQKEEQN